MASRLIILCSEGLSDTVEVNKETLLKIICEPGDIFSGLNT